ncbi:MAG: aggregation factor core [Rhodobacteraceae bacterium]|nr:aggregation factor core [Paracoccaceae bacterium]
MRTTTNAALSILAASVLTASAANADLRIVFDEGAPKDAFQFVNTGACPLTDAAIQLDLTPSQGKLIFDVTASGGGVEVFQPFEIVEGEDALKSLPTVRDGQTELTLEIASLAPDAAIRFTIDVDDTLGAREITVSDTEISGATVAIVQGSATATATFTDAAQAQLAFESC